MPSFIRARRVAAAALCAGLAGCATKVVPTLVHPPPGAPATLVVGEIGASDPQARRLARFIRSAMIDRLLQAEAFAVIYDRPSGEIDHNALMLDGEITEADRGSDVWRFVLGSGFGRPRLAASFTIADADGTARVNLAVASDDDGPVGLAGHWEPLSMERIGTDLGGDAADAIVRWTHGDAVSEPIAFWSQ